MKALLATIFTLMILTKTISQDHFVSYIDFNNMGQFAWQIEPIDDDFLLSVQTTCFDSEESCGGLLIFNKNGDFIQDLLFERFSGNFNSVLLSKDSILLIGEFSMGFSSEYSVFKSDKSISNIFIQKEISNQNEEYFNYVALASSIINNKILFTGASTYKDINEQISTLYELDSSLNLIKYLEFDFVNDGYTGAVELQTKNNEIFIYFIYKEFSSLKDSIKILKLDTSFNQTFEWSREVQDNAIPRGCVSYNNDMIITIPDDAFEETRNIWSIDPTGQTNWIYEWPNKQGRTNILRIKEAKNHDLLVMGQILNPDILDDKRYVAFVMRLNSIGEQIWIRYFKIEDQDTRLRNYVSDLVELENGDLQLTGQSRRIVYDPEFGDFRPDQDILWARIGGDGCIKGDCDEVYLISNTNDLLPAIVDISIHPNPTVDGLLTINVNDHSVQSAWIYDLSGQLIRYQKLEFGSTNVSLEGNNSIFLIRIVDKEGRLVHSEKVVRL